MEKRGIMRFYENAYMSKINRIVDWVTLIVFWLIVYYQALYLIIPVRLYMIERGWDRISSLLVVAGFGLFVWDMIFTKWYKKEKCSIPLILTIIVLVISAILNCDYGVAENVKSIIWQVVQMLIIFPLCNRFTREQLKKIALGLYWSILLFYLPAIVISLSQFFRFEAYVVSIPSEEFYCGFSGGRLRGIFSGIYFQGLFATLLGIISVYYAVITSKVWKKVLYGIIALLCFSQEILGEARSIQVGVAVAVLLVSFLYSWSRIAEERSGRKIIPRVLISMMIAVLCVGALRIGRTGLERGLKSVALYINRENVTAVSNLIIEDDWLVETHVPYLLASSAETQMDRKDSEDISTGRFKIWKDYLDMWKRDAKSILFGGSQGNYRKIIWDKYPDAYIIQRTKILLPRLYLRELFYDTHNAYLSILVTTGIAGVITMSGFFGMSIKRVLQYFFRSKRPTKEAVVLSVLTITILVAAFFDSDLFFKCTSTTVVFWFIAGLLLKETREAKDGE